MQVAEANGKGLIILGGQDTSRRLRTELFRLQVCLSSVNCIVCHMFMKKISVFQWHLWMEQRWETDESTTLLALRNCSARSLG